MTEPLNPTAPAGKSFFDFLASLSDYPQTEDLQGWVLPLFEQVAALHAQNRVAPLEGVAVVRFDYNQLWFENALARKPVLAQSTLDKVDELVTLNVTRRLKNMGSWVWQLQRTDVRRKVGRPAVLRCAPGPPQLLVRVCRL